MHSVYSLKGEFMADNYEYNSMKMTMKALSIGNHNKNCSSSLTLGKFYRKASLAIKWNSQNFDTFLGC